MTATSMLHLLVQNVAVRLGKRANLKFLPQKAEFPQ